MQGGAPLRRNEACRVVTGRRLPYNRSQSCKCPALSRAPKQLPRMVLNPPVTDLFAFRYEDFTLEGYEPHPHIKAEVAV